MLDVVFKHVKTLFSAFVVTSVINIAASIYFARILGPEVFAVYIASQLFREIVQIPFSASFNLPLYHFRKRISYVTTRLSSLILITFLLYFSLLVLLLQIGDIFIPNIDSSVVISLSVVFLLSSYGSIATTILQSKNEYKLASNINIIATIVSTLLSLMIIVFYQSIYVLVVKEVFYRVFLLIGSVHKAGGFSLISPYFQMKRSTLSLLLFQSYRVWGVNVLDLVSSRIDKILVNLYYTPIVLSNLQQARYYAEMPSTLLMPLKPLFLEKFTDPSHTQEEKNSFIKQATIILLSIGLFFGIVLYVYGSNAIVFLLGQEWILAAELIQGLSFYIAILPYAEFIKIVAYYKKQNRQVMLAQLVQIIIFILCFTFVTSYYTIQELPFVFLISTLSFIISLLFFMKKIN